MKNILETERLLLRPFNTGDTDFIIRLLNSPGWLQFIGDRNVKTKEDAIRYLVSGPFKSYQTNGFGLGLVALKSSNCPIGMCGLIKRETLEGVDIGFAFLPEFMGQGFAYEITAATVKYATDTLQLAKILAITLPSNTRSISLLKKIGLHYEKQIRLSAESEVLMLFSNNKAL